MPHKVRPPAILRTAHMHPKFSQVMLSVVWTRYTLMTAEILNDIDASTSLDQNAEIHQKVDEYCAGLQVMIDEWRLESIMKEDESEPLRYLIADHVMTMYSFMIGVRRLVRQPGSQTPVDNTTLGAARKVAQYSIDFTIDSTPVRKAQSVCIQYVQLQFFLDKL
jgi:ethanolamine utilization cobalamin adenosyltransferase